ncbi:enoyl-CoA hydratase-related protein [Nannocystis pusilla]|uniref:enoyl-CoA hydratase-related protein n=1 Tax=Nannocystis pusilla TaxID=889268 RepID=UPI003B7FD7FD
MNSNVPPTTAISGSCSCKAMVLRFARGSTSRRPARRRRPCARAALLRVRVAFEALITAVQGHAVGGGLGLAVLGDIIFAADDAQSGSRRSRGGSGRTSCSLLCRGASAKRTRWSWR